MGKPKELYEVLNIPADSTPEDIRRAYKTLAMQWHPDKHPSYSKPEAEARFKAITQAYEDLREYIEAGAGGGERNKGQWEEPWGSKKTPVSPASRAHKDDDQQIPQMPTTPRPKPPKSFTYSGSIRRKPPAVEKKLECTLEELCRGCKKDINFTREVVTMDGLIIQKQETQTIKVKPGWKKGTKITFEGMGDERPGCLAADIVFVLVEKEHPIFKRVDNDLVLKVEVPLVNALTGWSFTFRLLTGEKMNCTFKEEIVYPGYEKIIKGRGMPVANEKKGVKGDLRIKFNIVFPKQMSEQQRARIREVLKESN